MKQKIEECAFATERWDFTPTDPGGGGAGGERAGGGETAWGSLP